ncbi:MAG: alpha-amylase [Lachnospiraceae bacterium]|nr:alpha-amylase [Lachnospiraceae bacterium]
MRLGVTKTQKGYQFAFASAKEEPCKLLLYKKGEKTPEMSISMERSLGDIYVATVEKLNAKNYEYAYQVGEKIILDPYAKGISGKKGFGEQVNSQQLRCTLDFTEYNWEDDKHPEIPFNESLIYCTHLRGYTMDRSSKVRAKGTFKGMVEKIPYLASLGIKQLELMPVYEFEEFPRPKKKTSMYEPEVKEETLKLNYWGYTSGYYFAPKASYAAGKDASKELKDLVKALHKAGIELILEFYFDETAPPNFVMDCLKYWVEEYHIDGIHINRSAVPMRNIVMEPALKTTKIFTEYFDQSELSDEPKNSKRKHLAEYSEGFLVDARRLLKGDEDTLRAFADKTKKNPDNMGIVNYMANHNGFTMMDMVSYDEKHNEANGENNRDGSNYNFSWNCGVEGPSKKKAIMQLRGKQLRNAFAMLMFAQGIPLIYGGDEFGNSQQGNNNVYGQDNELSWVQWNASKDAKALLEYVQKLIAFRNAHNAFRMPKEVSMTDYKSTGIPDLSYHGENAWYGGFEPYRRHLGMMYGAGYAEESTIYVAYNLHQSEHEFGLPILPKSKKWKMIFNTAEETEQFTPEGVNITNQRILKLTGRTICVLEGMADE